jgi:hypothetical protein
MKTNTMKKHNYFVTMPINTLYRIKKLIFFIKNTLKRNSARFKAIYKLPFELE